MDNLFVVVDEYDHYPFKESKVTCHCSLVANVGYISVRKIKIVFGTGGDTE